MLLYLFSILARRVSVFNVFRYITFRAVLAALTALAIGFLLGPWLIRVLTEKKVGQTVRNDGPQTHLGKSGTPTMGGTLILFAIAIPTLLWTDLANPYVWVVVLVTAGLGGLGFVDDYRKLVLRDSKGVSPRGKLAVQFAIGLVASTIIYAVAPDHQIAFPLAKNFHPDLGWFYIPFGALVVVFASNAVNLTDGLDGLAIGPVMTCAATFVLLSYVSSHHRSATYLQIKYVPGAGDMAIFCAAMVGAGLAFLWFNTYPAQVFMGDVGALSLGGALGVVSVVTKNEIVLAIAGGIFVLEAVSVIVQVVSFKLTGKRVFRMAPIHHHYELKGWAEPKVIVRFWIVSFILALVAMSTLKLR